MWFECLTLFSKLRLRQRSLAGSSSGDCVDLKMSVSEQRSVVDIAQVSLNQCRDITVVPNEANQQK
jgi:hypothetical protein